MIIKNGNVFQEDGSYKVTDLYIENGRIAASEDPTLLFTNSGELAKAFSVIAFCAFTQSIARGAWVASSHR